MCFENFLCSYFNEGSCSFCCASGSADSAYTFFNESWISESNLCNIILSPLHQSIKELPLALWVDAIAALASSYILQLFLLKDYIGLVLKIKKFYIDYNETVISFLTPDPSHPKTGTINCYCSYR